LAAVHEGVVKVPVAAGNGDKRAQGRMPDTAPWRAATDISHPTIDLDKGTICAGAFRAAQGICRHDDTG
jgi:hypothetical protein